MSNYDTWLSTQPEDSECPACGMPYSIETLERVAVVDTREVALDEVETFTEETKIGTCPEPGCGHIFTWVEG